jgi:hypothetical protein
LPLSAKHLLMGREHSLLLPPTSSTRIYVTAPQLPSPSRAYTIAAQPARDVAQVRHANATALSVSVDDIASTHPKMRLAASVGGLFHLTRCLSASFGSSEGRFGVRSLIPLRAVRHAKSEISERFARSVNGISGPG